MATLTSYLNLMPEETFVLQEEGVIGIEILGKRKVSAALLSLPSPPNSTTGSTSSTSSSSSVSIRLRNLVKFTNALDLPMDIESVAALEHLGFTRKVAGDIFEDYAKRPNPTQNRYAMIDYVTGSLNRLRYQPWRDLQPREAMTSIGITDELQDALLDPRFTTLFKSESLLYWLKDTMRLRLETLEQLLDRLKNYASRTITNRKGRKRAKVEGLFEPDAASSSQEPAILLPTISTNVLSTSEEHGLPSAWVSVEAAPPIPDGSVALYKGKYPQMSQNLGFIQNDGDINLASIRSYAGGDFNHTQYVWYWTEEEATAEEYRKWAERRNAYGETWLIRVLVPRAYFTSLRKQQLFYSRGWKEYIWYCKNGLTPPAKFDKFWKAGEAEVMEGHICGCPTNIIQRIKKEDVQQTINENHLLVLGGKKATQWVLMHEETAKRFCEIAKGNIYIDVHPPTVPPKVE